MTRYVYHQLVRVTGMSRFYRTSCGRVLSFSEIGSRLVRHQIAVQGRSKVSCGKCLKASK